MHTSENTPASQNNTQKKINNDIPVFDKDQVFVALDPLMAWARPLIRDDQKLVLQSLHNLARLHPQYFDTGALEASVADAFTKPVLQFAYRTLLLEMGIARHLKLLQGETPEARFADFLKYIASPAGRLQLDLDYPLLRQGVSLLSMRIARNLVDVLQRVANDGPLLNATMFENNASRLISLKTEMGDRHINGASVVRLQFDTGAVFYKPRNMTVESAFAGFIEFLNQQDIGLPLRVPTTLDCEGYGYVQEISFKEAYDEAALRRYYQRFGSWVAITYVLGTSDLHRENIVAQGEYPLIIDAETLLQPRLLARSSSVTSSAQALLSALLLPCESTSRYGRDFSALYTPDNVESLRAPVGAGTDELVIKEQKVVFPHTENMPKLTGEIAQPARYAEAICTGFETSYRGLLALKDVLLDPDGPLASFKSCTVRTVLRPTQSYSEMNKVLSHPDYLKSAQPRELVLKKFRRGIKFLNSNQQVWQAEREALLRGDIPYFTAQVDRRDLYNEHGESLGELLGQDAWFICQDRIHSLSPDELPRLSRLIRLSALSTQAIETWQHWPATNAQPNTDDLSEAAETAPAQDYIDEARRIADYIISCGFHTKQQVQHFQLRSVGEDMLRLTQSKGDLYQGTAGLAVFFAELWLQTGEVRYLRYGELMLKSTRRYFSFAKKGRWMNGAYEGVAGWMYTLALLGHRLARPKLIDEAISFLPAMSKSIEHDKVFDVIAGSAGALLVLCELERLAPGRGAIEVARLCGQHLATNANINNRQASWKVNEKTAALTGFSHGTAGIAAALGRFTTISGDQQYCGLIQQALAFERTSYDGEGWRDLRYDEDKSPTHPYSWCHGGPGIVLGRLCLPQSMRDADWELDVARSLQHLQAAGFSGSHCLCHGQLGNLDILMQVERCLPQSGYAREWPGLVSQILRQSQQTWRPGSYAGNDELGLMAGLAGMGYQFLRITRPQDIPSVLLLELDSNLEQTCV